MTTIEDLNIKSILNMSHDEALEHLRQIRLSRRTPVKPPPKTSPKKESKAMPKMSAEQAKKLLEMLED